MSGWGYHWTPCGRGGALAGLGGVLAAVVAAAWVFANLAWIVVTVAACAVLAPVLALAVVPRLAAWHDRRDAVAWSAQRPAQLRAETVPVAFPAAGPPPALEQHVHFHYHAADREQVPAAIRTAIPGTAGDAITEGK